MTTSFALGCLLALYFYVGRWTFARIEGDYAAVTFVEQPRFWLVAILVFAGVVLQCSRSRPLKQFRIHGIDAAIMAFLSYMLLTTVWASDAELAGAKAFELVLILTVALVIAVSRHLGQDDQIHVGFWTTIVGIGVVLGALTLLQGDDSRVSALGGGPNTFGRNMGLMAFGAVFLGARYGILARLGVVVLVAMAALLVVRTGSRGGLLAFSMAAAVYTITANTSPLKKALMIATMLVATALAIVYTDAGHQAATVFQDRIVGQTMENRHLAGRDDLWFQSLEMVREKPLLGWGLDGFRANSWSYPHNIFMEVTVEGGIFGLVLLLNVVRVAWRHLRQRRLLVSRFYMAVIALTFTAAQTSGDLFDSRGLFLMMALAAQASVGRTFVYNRAQRSLRSSPRQSVGTTAFGKKAFPASQRQP
jgi:O-antigen ligase